MPLDASAPPPRTPSMETKAINVIFVMILYLQYCVECAMCVLLYCAFGPASFSISSCISDLDTYDMIYSQETLGETKMRRCDTRARARVDRETIISSFSRREGARIGISSLVPRVQEWTAKPIIPKFCPFPRCTSRTLPYQMFIDFNMSKVMGDIQYSILRCRG